MKTYRNEYIVNRIKLSTAFATPLSMIIMLHFKTAFTISFFIKDKNITLGNIKHVYKIGCNILKNLWSIYPIINMSNKIPDVVTYSETTMIGHGDINFLLCLWYVWYTIICAPIVHGENDRRSKLETVTSVALCLTIPKLWKMKG